FSMKRTLTSDEVCQFLRISRQKFYRLVKKGEFPARKVGSEWRILKDDLRAYIKGGRKGTG
ncbi:MAG: helix-turn-helix domain-containing protein, partial [Candidatus Bathyarchaeia archaeon]